MRVALLDLYNGLADNRGIPALTGLVQALSGGDGAPGVVLDRYDVRAKGEVPGLDYDVYLSSGGPGSPYDGQEQSWEADYFRWLDALWNHNETADRPKHALFICHSFQMLVRFFGLATVTERRSESFGIFPVHKTPAGNRDVLFDGLANPFYAADFRHWQAVEPDAERLDELGARILAREKKRPTVPYERAVMAVRIQPTLAAVQFHPEADPEGMLDHFQRPERREQVIEKVGQEKYTRILHRIGAPDFLAPTYNTIVPRFLQRAVESRSGNDRTAGGGPAQHLVA